MPIDQKEVLEYLGIKDAPENLEAFRKSFDASYIKKSPDVIKQDEELYGKLLGEKIGGVSTKLRRGLKQIGIELSDPDVKDKKIEEIIEMGLKKASEHFGGKITELEGQVGKGNDEKVTELQKQLEKIQGKYTDLKGLHDNTMQEYETSKATWATEKKGIKKQVQFGEAIKGIKWKSGITDIEKKGFFATFDEEHTVDLDDKDTPEVFDKSGKRIASGKESGKFVSLSEALENHGRKTGLWETNPIADRGRVIPPNMTRLGQVSGNGQPAQPAGGQRVVAAAALRNEGK